MPVGHQCAGVQEWDGEAAGLASSGGGNGGGATMAPTEVRKKVAEYQAFLRAESNQAQITDTLV
jgi:hypothetical protein